MSEQTLLDLNEISIDDWGNFIKNNQDIIFFSENACTSAATINTAINEMIDPILDTIDADLKKLKKNKMTKASNLYNLYDDLKKNNNNLNSKLGDRAFQINMGINYAEYAINAYNNGTDLDPDTVFYLQRIMNGNITDDDRSEAVNLISLTSPLASYVIGGQIATNYVAKGTSKGFKILGNFGVKKLQSVLTQANAKNLVHLANDEVVELPLAKWTNITSNIPYASLNAYNYILGSAGGAIVGAATSALDLYLSDEFENVGSYDTKHNWSTIFGDAIVGAVVGGLSIALGPAGAGAGVIFGYVGKQIVNEVADNISGDYVADTFYTTDANGNEKTYVIHGNGSGRYKKSNKAIPEIDSLVSEQKHTYKGVQVAESIFNDNLYRSTDDFMDNEITVNRSYDDGKHHMELEAYESFSDDWNQMQEDIKSCKTKEEAQSVYNSYKASNHRVVAINNSSDPNKTVKVTFTDFAKSMEEGFGYDPVDCWEYTKEG